MRFCHGANVAEQVSHVNEGERDAMTITSPPHGNALKILPKQEDFAENRSSTEHATPAGEMLACPRRVCYKFLTGFGPTTRAFHQFSCARN
jgi:hypothetical protein